MNTGPTSAARAENRDTVIGIVEELKRRALEGVDDDRPESDAYLQRCIIDVAVQGEKGVRIAYTRQIHEGRLHYLNLSMSFRRPPYTEPSRFDHRTARKIVPHFFGALLRDVVVYPPSTDAGKVWDTWHYRLFTTEDWMPNGYRPLVSPEDPAFFTWPEYERALFQ